MNKFRNSLQNISKTNFNACNTLYYFIFDTIVMKSGLYE